VNWQKHYMRLIGHLPAEDQAQLFSEFLVAKGVPNEIEQDAPGGWALWIEDESHVEPVRAWLAQFQSNPGADEYRQAAAGAREVRAAEARELEAYRRRIRSGQSLFRKFGGYGVGYLTYALIVVCVVVSLLSNLGHNETVLRGLFINDPADPAAGFLPEVRAGEVWRLFTPVLIHFGAAHLLFNMLWLLQLGSLIEGRQGRVRFGLLVLGLALGSNVAQYAVHGAGFGGMSGVIYGLFGYVWLRGKFDPGSGLFIDRQAVILMIVWFFACMSGWVGPVANVAHGAGLALGAGLGLLTAWMARRRPQ
jgi:GlpG protein